MSRRNVAAVMSRRNFALALPGAILLAQHISGALAQETNQSAAATTADATAARRMREAALAFLGSLDEPARKKIVFPLAAGERTSWSNLPVAVSPRVGLSFGSLPVESQRLLHGLLRASTSSQGYHKIAEIMRHDDLLQAEELEYLKHNPPRPRAGRAAVESMGSANYWVAIFGDPQSDTWAWLFTGHHLGATFTLSGNRVASMPLFLGAAPVEELSGKYAGLMALSHEALRGFDLVRSLRPEQAKIAVLSTDPLFSDVLTGVVRSQSLSRYEGLAASQLDPSQKRLLSALIDEYVGNADFAASEAQLAAVAEAGFDNLYFSWRGPADSLGQPFYYRVHGPRLIIEFAVQEPNHVHTIMRDPKNDYGMDWLGLHYEEHRRTRAPEWQNRN